MANMVYNMDGGLHSSAALGGLEDAMYGSSVANSDSFKVTAGSGMNVSIAPGNGLISTGTGFARRIATDAVNTVAITAASAANPRIDSIVAYIDNGISPTTSVLNNTNGILKFRAVAGTAAASPTAPASSAIQTAVGAGNPYMVLCNVRIPTSATALTGATFTDMRSIANVVTADDIDDGAITSAKLASKSVTSDKIDWATFSSVNYSLAEQATGGKWIDGKPIYKKTIDCAALPNATTKNVAHDITGLSYVIDAELVVYRTTNSNWFPMPYLGTPSSTGGTASGISYYIDATNVVLQTGTDRSNCTAYVTLYYTKA